MKINFSSAAVKAADRTTTVKHGTLPNLVNYVQNRGAKVLPTNTPSSQSVVPAGQLPLHVHFPLLTVRKSTTSTKQGS
jgi:hypothetical protein